MNFDFLPFGDIFLGKEKIVNPVLIRYPVSLWKKIGSLFFNGKYIYVLLKTSLREITKCFYNYRNFIILIITS